MISLTYGWRSDRNPKIGLAIFILLLAIVIIGYVEGRDAPATQAAIAWVRQSPCIRESLGEVRSAHLTVAAMRWKSSGSWHFREFQLRARGVVDSANIRLTMQQYGDGGWRVLDGETMAWRLFPSGVNCASVDESNQAKSAVVQ